MAKRARYGSGSIRAIGERRWEVRISVGRDPVTKRYRHVSRSVRGTKKEAEAALAALIADVRAGRGGHSGTDATLRELVEQWLGIRKDTLSVTTYEAYLGKARFRLIPGLGDMAVRRLTVHDIDLFYRRLSRDEGLAASTIKQIHNILSGSLDQAVRWGWRQDNPARWATLPAGRSPDVRPPSSVDVVAALAKADPEFGTFLRVAAAVGGRRGEVAALRWSAIDLDTGELVIAKGLVESRDGSVHEKDTKTHQTRRLALDEGTVDALRRWRRRVDQRAASCGAVVPPNGYVFSPTVDGGEPWRPYHWTSAWRRLRTKAGIDSSVRLHDLRHFVATRLLDAGVPVKTVSGRLGHARAATTLNVYAHFVPATDRIAADVMGGILTGPSNPAE